MKKVAETPEERCYWLASGETLEHPAKGCEVFKYVPRLLLFMETLWDNYENFDTYKWNEGATKEKAYEEYAQMYLCFREISSVDLKILWYLHSGMCPSVMVILRELQSAYNARLSALGLLEVKRENPLTACKRVFDE